MDTYYKLFYRDNSFVIWTPEELERELRDLYYLEDDEPISMEIGESFTFYVGGPFQRIQRISPEQAERDKEQACPLYYSCCNSFAEFIAYCELKGG